MKLSKEELLQKVVSVIGDNTSDDVLTLLEDISDTVNTETNNENWQEKYTQLDNDWQEKYTQLDNDWRQKYKERFLEGSTTASEIKLEQKEDVIDDGSPTTFEELFKKREV